MLWDRKGHKLPNGGGVNNKLHFHYYMTKKQRARQFLHKWKINSNPLENDLLGHKLLPIYLCNVTFIRFEIFDKKRREIFVAILLDNTGGGSDLLDIKGGGLD